ncbi:CocE/NonD family hydrolase [Ruegeria arenilitoris]|uniref:CocE/NonD family hydrolase n=1 Tax=Ruegeria arenilitoris TaxID=1173585 RepID=UPI00147FCC29|nr:CocE/NonD family hydrolase [Ruegeria arenilitoris]
MTQAKNSLAEIEDVPDQGIILSDGCRLSARIWRPVDAAQHPVPAILEYLPYRKRDGTTARDALTHPWFAKRGYACIRVDMRGNGDSQGLMEDEYTQQELDDAVEVIEWLAQQPWCSGAVGMMGISWGGFNALQVAALQPAPLKAIITLCSTADRYADDIHYKGGCLLNENLGWGATMWSYSSRPPDPALRDDWREMWLQRLKAEPFLPSVWLRHQTRDAYWRHGSVCEDPGAIRAATLAVGGWGDAYKNTVPWLVENLSAPVKGIVGPWVHKYPHFAVPEPRIGFLQEALRWWDRWLKGKKTGVEQDPAYRAYLMDGVRPARWYAERPGHWITEDASATSHLPTVTLPLSEAGLGKDGPLDTKIRSPHHCGMDGGEYCAIWLGPDMPGDQRADDALSACFDTTPLTADLDIVGAPRLRLKLSVDKPQAQIAVRLNHIHPDGAATRITYGVLNLTHTEGHSSPKTLIPGQVYDIEVVLDHIAYRVPEGHRLRVAVSSAYWPLIWPSPETAELHLTGGTFTIPQRDRSDRDEWQFAPPDADSPWQVTQLREATHARRVETDMTTGVIDLVIEDDFGLVEDADHGLVSGGTAFERWSIHPDDPLSARGRCEWVQETRRDGIQLRTEANCEMWSDRSSFHLRATLDAFENDVKIFSKTVEDTIPRDQM